VGDEHEAARPDEIRESGHGPGRPHWLDEVFTPGARFYSDEAERIVTIDPLRTVATFTLVHGPLMVADPAYVASSHFNDCLIVDLPAGTYPVQEAGYTYECEFMGDPLVMPTELAIRILVNDRPTDHWSMALPESGDIRSLPDGHVFGFGVDSGSGCFLDAAARDGLVQAVSVGSPAGDDSAYPLYIDPLTEAELLVFPTGGDGRFPVWIGHGEDDSITSVVFPMPFMFPRLTSFEETFE
jgi:hypothetical protein